MLGPAAVAADDAEANDAGDAARDEKDDGDGAYALAAGGGGADGADGAGSADGADSAEQCWWARAIELLREMQAIHLSPVACREDAPRKDRVASPLASHRPPGCRSPRAARSRRT